MKKKSDFMPTVMHPRPFEEQTTLAIGDTYVDARDKFKLCQPDRAFKKDIPKWNL
jgi:hypothetical protein